MNVTEIMKLALPPGTRLVAGAAGVGATVTWATMFRSRPPALDHLEGGELVLLSLAAVRIVDASLSLGRILSTLHERRVAALVVDGDKCTLQAPSGKATPTPCAWKKQEGRDLLEYTDSFGNLDQLVILPDEGLAVSPELYLAAFDRQH